MDKDTHAIAQPLTPEAQMELRVLTMTPLELQTRVKRYYAALRYIADVECKEGDHWCYEDASIVCEHNYARKVLADMGDGEE